MRVMTLFFAILAPIALASPARAADYYKFTSTIRAPGVKIARIAVQVSDKVADEKERWAETDITYLKKSLVKKVKRTLQARGLLADVGARLELTLVDIVPSRPTAQAMTNRLSLDFRSFGLGGATVEARLTGADGVDLGQMHYRWSQPYLDQHTLANSMWYDANRAFGKFARHLVKAMKTPPSSG